MSTTNYRGNQAVDFAAQEAEIAALEQARTEGVANETTVEEVSTSLAKAPGTNWEKRYGDLRRDAEQNLLAHRAEIAQLNSQIEALAKQSMALPTTEDEIREWMEEFPQVATIVEAIADKKARAHTEIYESRLKALESREIETDHQRAINLIIAAHPDFHDLAQNPEFHNWLAGRSVKFQDTIYKSPVDPAAAIDVLSSYKASIGSKPKATAAKPASAAQAVRTSGTGVSEPLGTPGRKWRESEIEALSGREYEKHMDEIDKARSEGRIIYDIASAGAR